MRATGVAPSTGGVSAATSPERSNVIVSRPARTYTLADSRTGLKGAAIPLQETGWSGRHPHGCRTRRIHLPRLAHTPFARLTRFVFDNSLLLLAGTIAAVAWANLDLESYVHIAHPLHFWVNDVGMVFFFALAAKEVFEATLPGGALASPRQALSPLAAAVGGMTAPALIYVALASFVGPTDLLRGWAIPCATDIAFSAMVARAIFPAGHPAIPFLLLLAIADDALGLIILAIFYPSGTLSFSALGVLMTLAVLTALVLRRRRTQSFWAYVIGPGVLSWAALYFGGFHPALALVPI